MDTEVVEQTKQCKKCGEVKPVSKFHKNKGGILNVRAICKQCLGHTKEHFMYVRVGKNFDMVCLRCRKQKTSEDFWPNSNGVGMKHVCISCEGLRSRGMNHDGTIDHNRRRKHLDCKSALRRKLVTEHPEHKTHFYLQTRLSEMMSAGIRSRMNAAAYGCTAKELTEHISSLFSNGMTWDNYGRTGWEIDHIVPVSAFDMKDPIEIQQCFHYTNLRPLWRRDNLSKGRSWIV